MVEMAAGWLIAAYQIGYGIAAFGAGALQNVLSLATIYRIVAVLSVAMAFLAVIVARAQGRAGLPGPAPATTPAGATTSAGTATLAAGATSAPAPNTNGSKPVRRS
jgi:hypothetical protein